MADSGDHDIRERMWIARVVVHDDHEAFAALVRLHQSAVRQFLRRLTKHDRSRADDLAQETFLKAYRHIGTFQGRGRFLSWLFGIAYQTFVTEQRRARGFSQLSLTEDVRDPSNVDEQLTSRRTFEQLIERLRPEERAAIVLHYRHELTHAEIADALHVPLGSVKSLIRRARFKLQAVLKDELSGNEQSEE
jgi:RNA polymerase sigma-70 factor, ECF subfamily